MEIKQLLRKLKLNNIDVHLSGEDIEINYDGADLTEEILNEIRGHKQEIISFLKHSVVQTETDNDIPKAWSQESYAISDAQRRLWVLSQFEDGSVAYNIPGSMYLNQDIDIDCFKRAIDSTIDRHEILRTVFKEDEEGEIRQWVLKREGLGFTIDYTDYRKEKEKEEKVKNYIAEDSYKPFDLEKGPLLRAALLQVKDDSYVFYFNMHHIISDGWSMEVLSKDVFSYYEAYKQNKQPELKELRIQYKDYSAWALAQLKEESFKEHRTYWVDSLSGELPLIDLSTTKQRPRLKTSNGGTLVTYLNKELSQKLKAYSQARGGTVFMGLLASLNAILYRYTGQDDLIIGSLIAGREHTDLEHQIGFYVNTLALRNEIRSEDNFDELFSRVKQNTLNAYSHQMYPFDRLVEELNLQRDTSRSAVFDVMLAPEYSGEKTKGVDLKEEELNQISDHGSKTSKFDLLISIKEQDYISFSVEYNTDVYGREMVKAFIKHYRQLLHALLDSPKDKIAQINYLSQEEKHELLYAFNDTAVAYPKEKTIVDLFEEQVAETAGNVAVVFEEKELTYRELNEQSNQLAHYLQKNYQIEPDDLIGIKQDRSEWMIISILGVLKAGGAYVPIDPEYPQERIDHIEKDTKCKVCIDKEELNKFKETQKEYSKKKITSYAGPGNLAYVIYTSGSTGKPKGVMIEHKNAYSFIKWSHDEFGNSDFDAVLFTTSLNFDLSIFEIFHTLTKGKELKVLKDGLCIPKNLDKGKRLMINTVPSVIGSLLQQGMSFESVSVLNMAGEPIPANYKKELKGKVKEIRNLYGPSEDTTYSTFIRIDKDQRDLIGKPISNTQIHILNQENQLQPIGVIGEICISGDGLARGYLNREELTKEKFISSPFKEGERLYKTGDLGRWLADGNIEFIGRKDNQVKIRGYRIELGEIEHALQSHKEIEEAVVLVKKSQENEKELVAYITSKAEQNASELRSYLKEILPDYMLPAHFVQLEEMPLTPNGKINKKALPDPEDRELASGIEYIAPRNEIEKKLVKIWQEVLRKEKEDLGIDEGFFEAGGNSIKLIALKSKIEREFEINFPASILFQYSTIRLQADMLLKENTDEIVNETKFEKLISVFQGESREEGATDIAVIGMSIKAPGSKNIHEFWENLKNGKESITHFTAEELYSQGVSEKDLNSEKFVRASSYLDDKENFDAAFFGYVPHEAKLMDPQIRVFHEVVWSALEDSGYDPLKYKGLIGLYAGAGSNIEWEAYSRLFNEGKIDGFTASNLSNRDFANSLIAHKLNFKGPVNSINTACSTSLVAIHQAVRSILSGENHIAIAGGVSINNGQKERGYSHQEGMILSKDGHNRTFDADSSGTVAGEGAGAVVLKKLSAAIKDGDQIYAIIKGSAINNDGDRKVGFTAPSVDGQAEVIRFAHKVANINPESISYVEAHGTATKLGDPIEVLALTNAFGKSTDKYCALGSVKTNIGHLDTAAGVAGFIKTVLCLKNKELVPSLHFKSPNTEINFKESPFYVNTELKEWPEKDFPRRAGVSSFGIGGTNAHVILEEAPGLHETTRNNSPQIITISAKTPEALERNQNNLKVFLGKNKEMNIADLSWTYQTGKSDFAYRKSITAEDVEDAINVLENNDKKRIHSGIVKHEKKKTAFMFSGQGSQYAGMGIELYEKEYVFKTTMDHCFRIAKEMNGVDYRSVLYPEKEEDNILIHQTKYTQPILFIFEYSLVKQLGHYGILPDVMIGHSIGEYVAACVSEVITLEDALKLVIKRGELIQGMEGGSMLSVDLSVDAIQPFLSKHVSVAAINTRETTVVSGTEEEIKFLTDSLNMKGIACQKLRTSHAFHSEMMNPVLDEFSALVSAINIKAPKIPYISNVTAAEATYQELIQSTYWTDHLRNTVRFSEGLEKLSGSDLVFIEVGPGKTLCSFVHQQKITTKKHTTVNLVSHPNEPASDLTYLLDSLAILWTHGVSVDWKKLHQGEVRRKVALPTYSFEQVKYPLGKGVYELLSKVMTSKNNGKRENIADWFYELSWKRSRLISPVDEIQNVANYLVFSDDFDIAAGLTDKIREKSRGSIRIIQVIRREEFEQTSPFTFSLNPKKHESYIELFKKLEASQILPDKIIHLWNISDEAETHGLLTSKSVINELDNGYYSLLNIAKSIGIICPFRQVAIDVITNSVSSVNSGDFSIPCRATVLGPVLTIPKEYRNILCRHVDIKISDKRDVLVTNLFNEVRSGGYMLPIVAYRQGDRWAQIYEPVKLEQSNQVSVKLKKGGVYLITGGVGGMGSVFGKFLAQEFDAKLILTGRKPKSEITTSELENIGREVIYLNVDVCDAEQMELKLTEAESLFGKINGIFHTAGIGDYSGIIQNRTKAQSEEVFASKIFGTMILHELAEKREIDVLVLCSSMASAAAPFGQVAYTSANIFQNNFARSIKGSMVHSIGWDTWNETGMAVNSSSQMPEEEKKMRLKHGLSNDEGIEVLKRVLGHGIHDLMIFTRGIEALVKGDEPELNSRSEVPETVQSRPLLSNEYLAPVSETEKAISLLFADFFGIKEIGIDDNFFDLGIDSLKAMTLISRIHQKLNIELRINDILEHSNIHNLGNKIDSLKNIGQMRKDGADIHFENEIEI